MSRITFDNLQSDHPELADAVQQFAAWLKRNPKVRVLDPRRLVRELNIADPSIIADLMVALAELGEIEQVFCVRDRNGTLISSEEYDTPDDVPETVLGKFGDPVLSSGRITTAFRERAGQ
jgi:hypothetical protein